MPGTDDNFIWASVPFYQFYIELSLNFRRKIWIHFGISLRKLGPFRKRFEIEDLIIQFYVDFKTCSLQTSPQCLKIEFFNLRHEKSSVSSMILSTKPEIRTNLSELHPEFSGKFVLPFRNFKGKLTYPYQNFHALTFLSQTVEIVTEKIGLNWQSIASY